MDPPFDYFRLPNSAVFEYICFTFVYRGAIAPRTLLPAHLGNIIPPGEKMLYGPYGPLFSGIQLKYGPYNLYGPLFSGILGCAVDL